MPVTVNKVRYFNTAEAAAIFEKRPITILRWIQQKKIQGKKIGRGYVITESAIQARRRTEQQAEGN